MMRKATVQMKESKEKNKLPVEFMDPTLEMTLSLHSFGWHKHFKPALQFPLGFSHPLQNSGAWVGTLTVILNWEDIEEFEVKKGGWVLIFSQLFVWLWWGVDEPNMRLNRSKNWIRWSFLSGFMFIPFSLVSMQNSAQLFEYSSVFVWMILDCRDRKSVV